MAEKASRRPSAPSVLVTLGGAALLIAVGFAVGLLAGVASEQPDLVLAPLTGQATSVALGELQTGAAEDTRMASAEFEPAPEPELLREPPPRAAPEAPPEVASAPPPAPPEISASAPPPAVSRQGFAIQVGAFREVGGAERLLQQLRGDGFDAYLADAGASVPARFRVRVGPVESRSEASRLAARLKDGHRLPTWVLSETGS